MSRGLTILFVLAVGVVTVFLLRPGARGRDELRGQLRTEERGPPPSAEPLIEPERGGDRAAEQEARSPVVAVRPVESSEAPNADEADAAPGASGQIEPSISGVVLDPFDRSVPGAQIRWWPAEKPWRDGGECVSASDGSFSFSGLAPGRYGLGVRALDWAPSEPEEVELGGMAVTDLQLVLRSFGAVQVQGFDPRDEPLAGWGVAVTNKRRLDNPAEQWLDAEGSAFFPGLDPGTWEVMVGPPELQDARVEQHFSGEEDVLELMTMFGRVMIEQVEVAAGETTVVRLDGRRGDALELRLRVVHESGPAQEFVVSLTPEFPAQGNPFDGLKMGLTDSDGRIAFDLPDSGPYRVLVGKSPGPQLTWKVFVPRVETHELELQLPGGRISGYVVGASGPRPGAAVSLQRLGMPDGMSIRTAHPMATVFTADRGPGRQTYSSADGTFGFDGLPAGQYRVQVGPAPAGFMSEKPPEDLGACSLFVTLHEDESIDDLTVQLDAGATIAVLLRDAQGHKVRDTAEVFVEDERGYVLVRSSAFRGRDKIERIGAGRVWIRARTANLTTVERRSVSVEVGETSEIELELHSGASLELVAESTTGEHLPAEFVLRDDAAVDVAGLGAFPDLLGKHALGEAWVDRDAEDRYVLRLGPLPLGDYDVMVRTLDGRTAARRVRLDAAAEAAPPRRFAIQVDK